MTTATLVPGAGDARRTIPLARRGVADPLDRHVGAKLRQYRILAGLSQEQVGQALGLTFQQIQKYERGTNRIGAGRLYRLAVFLNMRITAFYEGLEAGDTIAPTAAAEHDVMQTRSTLELTRNYHAIPSPAIRARIYQLVRSLAAPEPDAIPFSTSNGGTSR